MRCGLLTYSDACSNAVAQGAGAVQALHAARYQRLGLSEHFSANIDIGTKDTEHEQ
jgi:hypothetical protein